MLHITTYDDLAVENLKLDINYASTTLENDDQESMYEVDDIFVEKREWFDHLHTSLHTSRPKHATDDDGYETASYLKDGSYSTLRQNKNTSTKPNLEYRYILNNMPFSKHQSS